MGNRPTIPLSSSECVYVSYFEPGLCEFSSYAGRYSLLLADMGLEEDAFHEALQGANEALYRMEQLLMARLIVGIAFVSAALFGLLWLVDDVFPADDNVQSAFLVLFLLLWCACVYLFVSTYRLQHMCGLKRVEAWLQQHHGEHVEWVVVLGIVQQVPHSRELRVVQSSGWLEVRPKRMGEMGGYSESGTDEERGAGMDQRVRRHVQSRSHVPLSSRSSASSSGATMRTAPLRPEDIGEEGGVWRRLLLPDWAGSLSSFDVV